MPKREREWLTDDPPGPRLLWTVRTVIVGVWVLLLVRGVPDTISSIRLILATMPVGAERTAALDRVLQGAVFIVVGPLLVLAIFGFGVWPRRSVDVWNYGGPWFVPLWRSKKSRQRKRDDRATTTDPRA